MSFRDYIPDVLTLERNGGLKYIIMEIASHVDSDIIRGRFNGNVQVHMRELPAWTVMDVHCCASVNVVCFALRCLKVNPSNVACLALGGTSCWLNYEAQSQYSVLVRSTDSGTPPLSANFVVNITLKDINDRPRKLYITDYKVAENSLNGTVVGTFGASDEDAFQHLTYELTSDDHGM